jgi:Na+-transporting methylmalonyl-CoA/oxaloacetate decarboxylase gamma subunit
MNNIEIEGLGLKILRVATVVTFFVIVFFSINIVSALQSNEASVNTLWSEAAPRPGDTETVTITFQSNTAEELQIFYIGIHGDWMPADRFYGQNLSEDPVTVSGMGTYISQPFAVPIPSDASIGSHTYFIGIDGVSRTGDSFSWDSATATITIVSSTPNTPTITPSASPGGGQTAGSQEWLLYLAIITIVVVVVIIIIVVMMRRKRAHTSPATEPVVNQQKPEPEEKPKPEQDFII